MRNWITTFIIIILAIGFITTGVLYGQQSGKINDNQNQITALQSDITAIKGDISSLQGNSSASSPSTSANQSTVQPAPQSSTSSIFDVVSKFEPVVVRIDVTGSGFQAAGSGFIIDSGGYILTNEHVIDKTNSIKVTLKNGQQYSATIIHADSNLDLAILKLGSSVANLPVAVLGTSSDIIIGEDVIAIGFPLGPDLPGPASFTRGIVSAQRTLDGSQYVQTDVTINPGNSGGCLVTLSGKAIGVTTAGVVPPNIDAENIGLAIPVTVFQPFIQNNLKK